jgi:hypothetical protein
LFLFSLPLFMEKSATIICCNYLKYSVNEK